MVEYNHEDVAELYRSINPWDPANNPNKFAISMKPGQRNLTIYPNIDANNLLRRAVRFIAKKEEFGRFLCIVYDLPLSDMPLYINEDDNSKIIALWRLKVAK